MVDADVNLDALMEAAQGLAGDVPALRSWFEALSPEERAAVRAYLLKIICDSALQEARKFFRTLADALLDFARAVIELFAPVVEKVVEMLAAHVEKWQRAEIQAQLCARHVPDAVAAFVAVHVPRTWLPRLL